MTIANRLTIMTVAGIVTVAALSYLRPKPIAPNAANIQRTDDSLSSARDTLQTNLIQSARERAVSARAQIASANREAASRALAAAAKRRADSLAILARASDSTSTLWRMAYDERDAEVKALAADTVELRAQKDSLVQDTLRLRHDLDDVQKYVIGVERFNGTLKADLERVTECRIVGPIPCPSRTQTMAGTALVTTLLIVIAGSRK